MIDFAPRPHEPSMYLPPPPPPPDHSPLDNFNTIKKKMTVSYSYNNYYSTPTYDTYSEPEIAAATNVYHNLLSARDCFPRDAWRVRYVVDWTEDDTAAWALDTLRYNGVSEYDVPFCSLRIPGIALRGMKREQVAQVLAHPSADPAMCHKLGDLLFDKLQQRLHEEMTTGDTSALRYEYDPYQHPQPQPQPQPEQQTFLDLDLADQKNRPYVEYAPEDANNVLQTPCDSSDDAEDFFRSSETGSPASYGSDGSKSGDEDDKKKVLKRPPGRPRGSGRNVSKRPRSVSVPEFLRNLLHDPEYCPFIIKWEDYSQGKFRFVKPDEVAKLWGQLKQNDNMTFEKFSRAMRYHYRQSVLVSVPTARLVYQFGHKGPDYRTDNPNFLNAVKAEAHA